LQARHSAGKGFNSPQWSKFALSRTTDRRQLVNSEKTSRETLETQLKIAMSGMPLSIFAKHIGQNGN